MLFYFHTSNKTWRLHNFFVICHLKNMGGFCEILQSEKGLLRTKSFNNTGLDY
jgi:hypothetical protein